MMWHSDFRVSTKALPEPDVIKAVADKYLLPDDPPIMTKALEIIISEQQASTSYLQRKLRIGYNQAAEIVDKLEQRHAISAPVPGGQKRTILIMDELPPKTTDGENK